MTVTLRAWCDDDADWYAAATADAEIQRFTNEGAVTGDRMRDALRRLAGRAGMFAIADESGAPIGNIGWVRDDDPTRAEGYYWVAAEHRGRGVAVAALERLLDLAREAGLQRIRLVIDDDNVVSRRTAERAGFTLEGRGEPRVFGRRSHDTVVYERDS